MKVAVLSDTHGSVTAWEKALPLINEAELIIHCGDVFNHGPGNPLPEGYAPAKLAEEMKKITIPTLVCRGNCDSEVDQLFLNVPLLWPVGLCQVESYRLIFSHGHLFDLEAWLELGKKWRATLLFSGHTHQTLLQKKGGVLWCNPGSLSLPKTGAACLAMVDLTKKTVAVVEVSTGKNIREEDF
ncbi:MAG: phosphodiesterase [Candidatus Omnitrophica bacterium]|nr:phosphodiesterase [Candidatus Omnitrophota bacterium]